jgi:hypothetical protein
MITANTDVLIEIAYTDTNPVDLQKLLGQGPGQPIPNNEPFMRSLFPQDLRMVLHPSGCEQNCQYI